MVTMCLGGEERRAAGFIFFYCSSNTQDPGIQRFVFYLLPVGLEMFGGHFEPYTHSALVPDIHCQTYCTYINNPIILISSRSGCAWIR